MATNWLKARQTRYTAYAGVYLLVVIAILAAANWLAQRHNKSFDTTGNKRYSLSDQTAKIVKGLKQDITITYFDETAAFQKARDLLDRYEGLGSSRLKIEYVDMLKKPQMARELGVRMNGTILVRTGQRREEARAVSEEEVTSALIRVVKEGAKTVCFVTGFGERSLEDGASESYSRAKEQLERNNYKTRTVSLIEKAEIPNDCAIVVSAGPRQEYPPPVVDVLKKFVEDGGHALFMLDPPMQSERSSIAPQTALGAVLTGWGVTPKRNIILSMGREILAGLSPEVAIASDYGTHPIVRDMRGGSTAFPLSQSLEVKPGEKSSAEKLGATATTSIAIANPKGVLTEQDLAKGEQGSHILAAAGVYRTDKPNVQGRFVVTGTADFMANRSMSFLGNRDLFLNIMNWLSSDEDLISIRPKEPEDRRIQLTRGQMTLIRTTSQFLIPLGIILMGVLVWWRRR